MALKATVVEATVTGATDAGDTVAVRRTMSLMRKKRSGMDGIGQRQLRYDGYGGGLVGGCKGVYSGAAGARSAGSGRGIVQAMTAATAYYISYGCWRGFDGDGAAISRGVFGDRE